MPEGANAATELKQEHGEIEQLAARIADLQACPERTELLREANRRFLTHTRAEERYLLPAVQEHLPAGQQEYVDQLKHTQGIRELIGQLGRADVDSEEYEQLGTRIAVEITQHIDRQETVLLPSLLDASPYEESNALGRQLRKGFAEERGTPD